MTGLQDYSNDGDQVYTVVLGAATSADLNFNALNPADLSVTNLEVANIAPVNVVPAAQTVNEDTPLVFSFVNGNPISISDVDAGTNVVEVALSVTNGTLTLATGFSGLSFVAGDGTADASMTFTGTIANINTALDGLRFDPTAEFSGTALLTIDTNDLGNSGSGGFRNDIDTVAITILSVNDAPTATDTTINATEDTVFNGTLPAATDVEGDTVTYALGTAATDGTAVVNSNGSFSYTPTLNFNGADSFTYTVSDGNGGSNTYTVAVGVAAVNDAPTTTPVNLAAIVEDSGVRVITQAELLANAADVDGPSLTATGLAISTGSGNLVDNGNGTWNYTPALNDDTSVSFSYTITDGSLNAAGSATLDITPVNDAPTTTPVTLAAIAEDSGPRLITQAELLANAADVEGDSLTAINLAISSGSGTLIDNGNGTWNYTPALDDDTAVSFSYTVTDGGLAAGSAALDITPVNDAPTLATPFSNQMAIEDTAFSVQLAANTFDDVDAGDTLTYTTSALPAWLSFDAATRTFSGTPANADVGTVTVTLRATDGSAAFIEDTFAIVVANSNDVPTVANAIANQAATEDAPFTFQFAASTFDDVDAGDSLTYSTGALPAWLSFDAATRTFSGTPLNEDVGTTTVTLRATDTSGAFVENSFNLVVANTNDAPIITSAAQMTGRNGALAVSTVSARDVDVGDTLTYSIVGGADAGRFVIDASTGVLRFVSVPNFAVPADADRNNVYEVVVQVSDSAGATDSQALSVSIALDVTVGGPGDEPSPNRDPEPEPERATPESDTRRTTATRAPSDAQRIVPGDSRLGDILGEPLPTLDAPQIERVGRGFEVTIGEVRFTDYAPNNTELLRLLFTHEDVPVGSARLDLPDPQTALAPEVLDQIADSGDKMKFVFEQVGVSGVALTVGVVWWATRVGGLVASMMVTLPAWRSIDPLPVLRDASGAAIGDADADAEGEVDTDEDTPTDEEAAREKVWEGVA